MERPEILLSPLFSISGITEKYRDEEVENFTANIANSKYRLSDAIEPPFTQSEPLWQVTRDFQESLDLELGILRKRDCCKDDLDALFIAYKNKLSSFYESVKNAFEYETIEQIPEPQNYSLDDFWHDLTMFSSSALTTQGAESTPPEDTSPEEISCEGNQVRRTYDKHANRPAISNESRRLLESVFAVVPNPNIAERKLLAERCHLEPRQVRVWFANKRARTRASLRVQRD